MALYDLDEINLRTVSDPKEFCAECEEKYNGRVRTAADMISDNLKNSPIILLSGPSGSGKTTTAMKISEELSRRGIKTHYVSMDDYYKNLDENTPRTPEGDYDLESPLCLDFDLLNKHFVNLAKGEKIYVPKYEFSTKIRVSSPSKAIKLGKDEMCVFEGIHALNPLMTDRHPEAFRLHVSAASDITFKGNVIFRKSWFRLVRRTVRDFNFRGTDAAGTMAMWANVRRGENLYITPYKKQANYQLDTAMQCEVPVLNAVATELFRTVPEGIERYNDLRMVLPALQLFGRIDESDVAPDSLLREFIGGGIYA